MPRRPLCPVCLLLILLVTGADALARKEKTYRIAGAARDEKGKTVPSEVLSEVRAGVRVSIRYLDPPAAGTALESVVPGAGEIFQERTDSSRGHLVFALQIENGGALELHYEPGQGRLITDRNDAEFPLDYTGLYRLLTSLPGGAPSLEEMERAVYSRSASIAPGGSVRKLLVFEGPREARFRKFEVRIGAIQTREGEIDIRFPFRRFRVEP